MVSLSSVSTALSFLEPASACFLSHREEVDLEEACSSWTSARGLGSDILFANARSAFATSSTNDKDDFEIISSPSKNETPPILLLLLVDVVVSMNSATSAA